MSSPASFCLRSRWNRNKIMPQFKVIAHSMETFINIVEAKDKDQAREMAEVYDSWTKVPEEYSFVIWDVEKINEEDR